MLLGAHVSHAGGLPTAVDRAEAIGARALQIFPASPRAWRLTEHAPEAIAGFRARAAETGIRSVIHATYLINLGSTDDAVYSKSVRALRHAMELGRGIGADGVVFHVGSHLGRGLDAALEQIVPALQIVLGEAGDGDTRLLLENSAGAGGTIGRDVGDLERIVAELDGHPLLGVCLDTCHLWASGVDISRPEVMDGLLDDLDRAIGIERVRCLHVNDSQLPLGCNRDRHENVGQGLIGDGLATMLGHPRLQGLPAVAETPGAADKGVDEAELAAMARLHRNGVRRWKRRGR